MLSAIELTMKLVGGKWKCLILYHLGGGARRTRDLLERLGGISPKGVNWEPRALEADGLVAREVFAEVLTRVEYRLSEEGKTFLPALYMLCDWGKAYGLRHGTETSPCPPPAE